MSVLDMLRGEVIHHRRVSTWRLLQLRRILTIGDCLSADGAPRILFVDWKLQPRDGDVVLFRTPSCDANEFLAKWLLEVDGDRWLAAKYGAVLFNPAWHQLIGTVVAELATPPGSANPAPAERIAKAIDEDRKVLEAEPDRDDLARYPDTLDREQILAAIRAHGASRMASSGNVRELARQGRI